jgi:fumarate hydratase class II
MPYRTETDSIGAVQVPRNALYGAQTARSIQNFSAGWHAMPIEIIQSYLQIKKASALMNNELSNLSDQKTEAIVNACDEILGADYKKEFPLRVWQTGSGTQTNMNVNEVICNLSKQLSPDVTLHPNDDVNKSQSSNDTFPAAMHMATYALWKEKLEQSLNFLIQEFSQKREEFNDIIKVGRTHLMDATPLRLGDEFGGYVTQLVSARDVLSQASEELLFLPLGGTAVGSGINTPKGWSKAVAARISTLTNYPYQTAPDKFAVSSAHDVFVTWSAGLKRVSMALMKITNDIRWMGSGPRAGFNELSLPANEPGSSIMPGKVNPTQCESLTQICVQVFGNDAAVSFAASQGSFELNVYKPVIIYNVLESMHLLADGMELFGKKCVAGLKANKKNISMHLNNSLMLVTALAKHIGYDKAAEIAKTAHKQNKTLREVSVALGYTTEAEYLAWVKVEEMV